MPKNKNTAQTKPLRKTTTTKTTASRKTIPGVILDMQHCTVLDSGERMWPRDQTRGGRDTSDTEYASSRMIKALQKGYESGPFTVPVSRRVGERELCVSYAVRISRGDRGQDPRVIDAFVIEVATGQQTKSTQITVRFGQDHPTMPTQRWVAVQANPTSLLSGQNIRPVTPTFKSLRRELAFQFTWPHLVVLAICEQADPGFEQPAVLADKLLSGLAVYQNIQFANYLTVPDKDKALSLDLIYALLHAMRIEKAGDRLGSFNIGELLGIKAQRFTKTEPDGRERTQTVVLRKMSGTRQLASLSFYDKAHQTGLNPSQARELGVAGLLRLDTTLMQRGIGKLLSDAEKLARREGLDGRLARNGAGQLTCTGANIVGAIAWIELYYSTQIGGVEHRGLLGWIVSRLLIDEFHLGELLTFSPKRWRRVKALFAELGERDPRYKQAFSAWRGVANGNQPLRVCLKGAGLSKASIARCLGQVRVLGLSGQVPPKYWVHLESLARDWGASTAELAAANKKIRTGEPVADLVRCWGDRVRPALAATSKAITTFDKNVPLVAAPVAGTLMLTKPDGRKLIATETSKHPAKARKTDKPSAKKGRGITELV